MQLSSNSKGGAQLGYNVKIQKVERPTNTSFYVNFPAAIAEATHVQKGEEMEWLVEDRNTFILKRIRERKSFLNKKKPNTKLPLA
jgi:antitoxin component of MazEF toxin-antitoxin module